MRRTQRGAEPSPQAHAGGVEAISRWCARHERNHRSVVPHDPASRRAAGGRGQASTWNGEIAHTEDTENTEGDSRPEPVAELVTAP
jgi:hypothetical protein